MAFEISDIIRVTTTIQPTTAPAAFGRTLLFTDVSEPFGIGDSEHNRYQVFNTAAEAFETVPSDEDELRAAVTRYFSQSPYPPPLVVGRSFSVAVSAEIIGDPVVLSSITGNIRTFRINNNEFTTDSLVESSSITGEQVTLSTLQSDELTFTLNGVAITTPMTGGAVTAAQVATVMQDAINADNAFNGVSVDAVTSGTRGSTTLSMARPAFDITDLPAAYVTLVGGNNIFGSSRSVKSVASQLQDAIRNNFNNAVVVAVVSGEREDVSLSNSSGTTGNVAFDVSVLGNVPIILSGTDRTVVFGTSPRLVDGFSADASIADALNKISGVIPDWYFVVTDNSFDDDGKNDIANWASASLDKSTILDIVSNDVSAFEDVDSDAYAIANRNSGRVNVLWSRHEDYKGISLAARFSGIDLSGGGIIRTAKFLALPGSSADNITSSQKSILDGARANYYTTFGPTPILAEGVTTSDDIWIDLQYWLDWFAQTMQIELFNLFRGSVPQTDEGLDQMRNVMEAVCALGVTNGGIAPGVLSETTAGDVRRFTGGGFSGYLTTGYLVAINAISSQTLSQRATRTAPASRTYLKGSGALHDADIIVDFTQ